MLLLIQRDTDMAFITDPSTGNDTVTGTDLADTFIWRGGNDTYAGGTGGDTLVLGRDDLTYWGIGREEGSVVGSGDGFDAGEVVLINTSSIETYEFVEGTADSERGTIVDAPAGATTIVRGTTGKGYTVFGSDSDDTLVARGVVGDATRFFGFAGDDTFRVEIDSGSVFLFGGNDDDFSNNGIDRLIVDALRADVEVSIDTRFLTTSGSVATLAWGTNTASFRADIDEIQFMDATADGSPLVLSYNALVDETIAALPITGTDAGEVLTDLSGDNRIEALGGNDWINMTGGNDTVDGGAGTDMISFAEVRAYRVSVDLNAGTAEGLGRFDSDRLTVSGITNIENATGTSSSDLFRGDDSANWFRGLGGSDRFYASAGRDLINGGGGSDGFFSGDDDDNISLLRGRVWAGEGTGTRLSSIEWVFGGDGDDTITGDHGGNALYGDNGDDVLMGNGGDDQIYGGIGTDVAVFGYAQDQYDVIQHPTGRVTVEYTGAGAGDGLDSLVQIEILRFADGDMIL